jgi:inner membrane protein
MPMTTTHALMPLAAAVSFGKRPLPWRLVIGAMIAAALPDIDAVWTHFLHLPRYSIYAHRGAAHSLFAALLAGLVASAFHKWFGVRPLTAAVVVAASMASHGIFDMMTEPGRPVAYLWPLSSVRLFADWRPIYTPAIQRAHLLSQALARFESELLQLMLPMLIIVLVALACRARFARRAVMVKG